MSTSTELGLIKGLPATAAALTELPVSTSTWQTFANNLNHTADVRSRVLVNYAQYSTTAGGRSVTGTAWERLFSFGPFPLLVRADGTVYPIRARVGGRAALNGTSYLRIGVCPVGQADAIMSESVASSAVYEPGSTASLTNAWLGVSAVLVCPVVWARQSIVDAVSTASPHDVGAVMATIEVWGKSAVAGDATATQAYAAEYCGT